MTSLPQALALAAFGALPTPATPAPALQKTPQEEVPTAARVLERMERAIHGEAAVEVKILVLEGTSDLYMDGAVEGEPFSKGRLKQTLAPGASHDEREYPPMGHFVSGESDGVAWMIDPFRGARVVEGLERGVVRRGRALQLGLGWRKHYGSAELLRTEELGGRPHYVLALRPVADAGKEADHLYVDAGTHLPSRHTYLAPLPDGGAVARMVLDQLDWRPVDGVMYPFETRLLQGTVMARQVYGRVVHNVELPEGFFDLPAEVDAAVAEESRKEEAKPAFTVQEVKPRHTAAITVQVKTAEISKTLAVILPEVMAFLTETGAAMTGPPYTRYHDVEGDVLTMEAGMPVREAIEGRGRIAACTLPGGRVVTGWHVGHYEKLAVTHRALTAWTEEQGLVSTGGPWEVYWTDPGLEPDPGKWRTQLFLPVK